LALAVGSESRLGPFSHGTVKFRFWLLSIVLMWCYFQIGYVQVSGMVVSKTNLGVLGSSGEVGEACSWALSVF
jgi:hypothetical protein